MNTYQPNFLKSQNRKLVFDLFKEHEKLSRSQITKLTNMSFPTAMKVVDFLISKEIVHDIGEMENSITGPGRRSKLLEFNPDAYHAIGVEIEGQIANIGKVNLNGEIRDVETVIIEDPYNLKYFHTIIEIINKMRLSTPIPILGVGIGFPANINPTTNEIISYDPLAITEPINFYSLIPLIETQLNIPLFIDNDVNLACAGEHLINNNDSLVYISLGSGLGAGIILEGTLWRGLNHRAGEIGNFLTNPLKKGLKTLPGLHNMESKININALNQKFGIALEDKSDLDQETINNIIVEIIPVLSTVIYNIQSILDVKTFVLSGLIPNKLDGQLYAKLMELFSTLPPDIGPVTIKPPSGKYPVISGAASIVFQQTIFEELL